VGVRWLAWLVCLMVAAEVPCSNAASMPPALAMVASIRGTAVISSASSDEEHTLSLLDPIPSGAVLRTGPDASLRVVFANGARYELGASTVARVDEDAVTTIEGRVVPLPPVPTMPELAIAAVREGFSEDWAATVIRCGRVEGLEDLGLDPPTNSAIIAAAAVLRFSPLPGASRYQVTIEDAGLNVVYTTETSTGSVELRPDTLAAGANYCWCVRTIGLTPSHGACAVINTLSEDAASQRADMARLVAERNEPDLKVLLAAMDYRLGLRHLSCEDITALADKHQLEAALSRLGCQPVDPDEGPPTASSQ
jgi:hypothetical protein